MTNEDPPLSADGTGRISITAHDLQEWGDGFYAYARPIRVDGQDMVAIFGASGEQLGLASDFATARIAIKENDLEPLSVH